MKQIITFVLALAISTFVSVNAAADAERRDLTSTETCLEMCTKQTNRCEMRDTLRTVDKATQCKVVKDRCDAACSEIVKAEKRSQPAES